MSAPLTFSEALSEAEWLAKSAMRDRITRIDDAVQLVKAGAVLQMDDGHTWEVDSSIPGKRYSINSAGCACADSHYRGDLCKHTLAIYLSKKVLRLMTPPTATPQTPVPVTVPQGLPEAPASVNVRLHIDGKEIMLTLRDTDEARLLARLAVVIKQFPDQPSATHSFAHVGRSSPQGTETPPTCPEHGTLKKSSKGTGYYCPHKTASGDWCSTKA